MKTRTPARMIPERFLRQLWKQTAFRTESLATVDGKPVEILSTGTLNTDGGPDFRNARVRIGGTLYRGDVELHRTAAEWKHHSHDLDPKYNAVVLHVVLYGIPSEKPYSTQSKRTVPILPLEPFLDTAYHALWEQMIMGERAERLDHIACQSANEKFPDAQLKTWLTKLANERIELKVRRFEERLIEMVKEKRHGSVKEPAVHEASEAYGETPAGLTPEHLPSPGEIYSARDYGRPDYWEQLLYEGIMEALGYAKNQAPFVKLARTLPRSFFLNEAFNARSSEETKVRIESALFSVSGLMPLSHEVTDKESSLYLTRLRTVWSKLSKLYKGEMLTEGEWQFFRMRPENFPTIRLAAAAQIIMKMREEAYLRGIIAIVKDPSLTTSDQLDKLEEMLIVPADPFWSRHYRFAESSPSSIPSLLGKSRAREIILNVVIPVCLLYARIFKDRRVREGALALFQESPAKQGNTIVRKMDDQLVRGKFPLGSAMLQQGTLQLYKLYCLEERCDDCAVGKAVFPGRSRPTP